MSEKQMPKHCPVVGAGARMTRAAFAVSCLAEQNRVTINDKMLAIFTPVCLRCAIGHEVKRLAGMLVKEQKESETGLVSANEFYGRLENRFAQPVGLEFVELEQLLEERTMAEAGKSGAKKADHPVGIIPESRPVPVGNWKTMSSAEAQRLDPKDLVNIWLLPMLIGNKRGVCPNCRRENMGLASYGICGCCRAAIVNKTSGKKKTGIDMLEALAAKAAEKNPFWFDKGEVIVDEVSTPVEGGGQPDETPALPEFLAKPVEEDELQSRLAAVFLVLPGYESLAGILQEAMDQAQSGKGVERHAGVGEPFDEQMICAITRRVGLGFPLGQAIKKAVESKRIGGEAGRREILGAINYLSAAVICGREGVE